jgi:signal peptidase II
MKKVFFNHPKRWLVISVLLLFIDIAIKRYVYVYIPEISWKFPVYPYGGIPVFHNFFGINFSINYISNKGAAWGILSNYSSYLLYFRTAIVFVLIFYVLFFLREKNKIFPFCFVLAGAIGNIVDFFIYGHVIDMFHFNFWGYSFPIFNFADSMISIGITFLFITSIFYRKKDLKEAETI